MKYCKICIMKESFPKITFNNGGVCNYCLEYQPYHRKMGRDKLLEALYSREKVGQYHCVVPLSGGKDSTYILYYIVKELKLNPIAVSYSSGYQSEISKENVKNACNILGVPLVVIESPRNIQTKLLKESILVSKKLGRLFRTCGNCEAIIRTVSMNTGKDYGAPFVIWGSSALESIDNKNYANYKNIGKVPTSPFITKWSNIIKTEPKIFEKIIYLGYHSAKFNLYSISQRRALNFPARLALNPIGIPPFSDENPKFVHFFDYISWDSIRNVKLLEDELDWKHPADKDSRFDCTLHCLVNFQHLKVYGITQDGLNFCNFIREGRMEREEALNREEEAIKSIENECKELFQKIGLKDFELFIHGSPWR